MEEIWVPVPDYEGIYEVSSFGRLKSLERDVFKADVVQHRNEKIKGTWPNEDGYLQCKLSKDGDSKNIAIHRIVASAFIVNPDGKPEVNHKDGNRQNNHVDNLEWVTHAENVYDCVRRGTHVSKRGFEGEKNPNYGNRKLSEKYANNPELTVVQSRPGAANGRARPVAVRFPDGSERVFDYIGECARWLIENNYCSIKFERMCLNITRCANDGTSYKNMTFCFV